MRSPRARKHSERLSNAHSRDALPSATKTKQIVSQIKASKKLGSIELNTPKDPPSKPRHGHLIFKSFIMINMRTPVASVLLAICEESALSFK